MWNLSSPSELYTTPIAFMSTPALLEVRVWDYDSRSQNDAGHGRTVTSFYSSMDFGYFAMPDIVLVEPEIPQNTGNIGRTCVALGMKLWLVRPLGFQLTEKQLRRAGLDYWEHLEHEVLDSVDAMFDRFQDRRLWFFSKKAQRSYVDVEYAPHDVLVFGRETFGLPEAMLETHSDHSLLIPIRQEARSLNLATAVAIVGYEAQRQFGLVK